MVWYNPTTWTTKKDSTSSTNSKQDSTTTTKDSTNQPLPKYDAGTNQFVSNNSFDKNTTSKIVKNQVGGTTIVPKSGVGSGGSSSSSNDYKTTDKDTNHNPATHVLETPLTNAEIGAKTGLLKKNPSESDAAYNARLAELGRSTKIGYQSLVKPFSINGDSISQGEFNSLMNKQEIVTDNNIGSNQFTINSRNPNVLSFTTPDNTFTPYKGTPFGLAAKESLGLLAFDLKKLVTVPQDMKNPFTPFFGKDGAGGVGKPEYYSTADYSSMGKTMQLQNLGVPSGTVQGAAFGFNVGQEANLKFLKGEDILKYSDIYSTQGMRTEPYVSTAAIVGASFVVPEATGGYLTLKGFQGLANNDPNAGLNLVAGASSVGYTQYVKEIKLADKLDLANYKATRNPRISFISDVQKDAANQNAYNVITNVNVQTPKGYTSTSQYWNTVYDLGEGKGYQVGGGVNLARYKNNVEVSGTLIGGGNTELSNPAIVRNYGNTKVILNLNDALEGTGSKAISTSSTSMKFTKGTFNAKDSFNINNMKFGLEKPVNGKIAGIVYPTKSDSVFGFRGSTENINNVFLTKGNVKGIINMPTTDIGSTEINLGSLSGRTTKSMRNIPAPVQDTILKQVASARTLIPKIDKPVVETFSKTSSYVPKLFVSSSAYTGLNQYERTSSVSRPLSFPKLSGSTSTSFDFDTKTKTTTIPVLKNFGGQASTPNTKTLSIPSFNTGQTHAQDQTTRLIQTPQLTTPNVRPPVNSYPPVPTNIVVPFPFALPNFGLDSERPRRRKFKGKQPKKYTPSFGAIIFNIRGKAPKGIETGARTRPIPKGFSFANKLPKFRFPKI